MGTIDAGIYYPPGSLKAKLSVDGNLRKLEPYCQEHGIPFQRIGKLLVATDELQIQKLRDFQSNAKQNGVSFCSTAVPNKTHESRLLCTLPRCNARAASQATCRCALCDSIMASIAPPHPCREPAQPPAAV